MPIGKFPENYRADAGFVNLFRSLRISDNFLALHKRTKGRLPASGPAALQKPLAN
jgi:hypothetical protein